MPSFSKQLTGLGIFEAQGTIDKPGILISEFGGDSGGGVLDFVTLTVNAHGFPPNYGSVSMSITGGTTCGGASDTGLVSAYQHFDFDVNPITFPQSVGDPSYCIAIYKDYYDFPGNMTYIFDPFLFRWSQQTASGVPPASFWESFIYVNVHSTPVNPYPGATIDIFLSIDCLDPATFTTSLINIPHTPTATHPTWDGAKGKIDLTVKYDNANNENPSEIIINRSRNGGASQQIATLRWVSGQIDYTYTDFVFALGTYAYTFQAYKALAVSSASSSASVSVSGTLPDIDVTGSATLAISANATMLFISDPSGIYTLVRNKTHDTLYERLSGVTTVETKIPDPFVKTAFLP